MAKLRTVSILFFCLGALFISKISALNMLPNKPFNDTMTLAATKKGFTLKQGQTQIIVPLKVEIPTTIQRYEYSLILESVQVNPLPEGVYEVFLSAYRPRNKHHIPPEDSRFIGVLDLYNLSNQTNKSLSLAIAEKSKSIQSSKKKGDCYFLIVQFTGNKLPNGTVVPHTGNLSCGFVRLVQY